MRKLILGFTALALALPATFVAPMAPAQARNKTYNGQSRRYYQNRRSENCRYSSGTTGLVAGGVGGAIVGDKVIGGGIAGPLLGAVGGALAGRAVDRSITAKKRCYRG